MSFAAATHARRGRKPFALLAFVSALVLPAFTAAAQDEGFFLDGTLDGGYVFAEANDAVYFTAVTDFGYRPRGGEGLGVALGLDVQQLDASALGEYQLNGFYPVITYENYLGMISVGNPRSVTDRGYGADFSFAHSAFMDQKIALSFGSLVQKATLDGDQSYGIRYDGGLDNALIGFSLHRADRAGSPVTTYAIAFSLPVTGDTVEEGLSLFGGAERYSGNGKARIGYTLGAMLRNTKLSGALRYRKTLLAPDAHIYEGRMEYRISDRLMLGLSLAHESQRGDSSDHFGIGAQYTIIENGYLRGSLLKEADTDSPALDLSVGFRF